MIEHHVACWLGMCVNSTSVGLVCMRLWVQPAISSQIEKANFIVES